MGSNEILDKLKKLQEKLKKSEIVQPPQDLIKSKIERLKKVINERNRRCI